MATESPISPPSRAQTDIFSDYSRFKHNAAICLLIGAPILIAIPPRKLDLFTFSLAAVFVASANQLTVERTGRGLLGQFAYRSRFDRADTGTESAVKLGGGFVKSEVTGESHGGGSLLEEKAREGWSKSQVADWKQERLMEEQEKLNEGEGYGDMIMDQIWAVWNQEGKKKDKEDK